jgi:hypothetical protein
MEVKMIRIRIASILFLIVLLAGFVFPGSIEITKVGEWGTSEYKDVFVQGNYAYLAFDYGLMIIDISTPASPTLAGNRDSPHLLNLNRTRHFLIWVWGPGRWDGNKSRYW